MKKLRGTKDKTHKDKGHDGPIINKDNSGYIKETNNNGWLNIGKNV